MPSPAGRIGSIVSVVSGFLGIEIRR